MTRALALATVTLAASHIYPSTAVKLAPTASEIGFTAVGGLTKAKKPKAALATGWKNGLAVIYVKGSTKKPTTEALATIFVYSTAADAKKAWTNSCAKCTTESAPAGIKLKAEAGTSSGLETLVEYAICSNVYLNTTESSTQAVSKIDSDIAGITNAVFARAIHFGLSSCNAK